MITASYVIKATHGLHARPATELVNLTKMVKSRITVEKEGKEAEANRIMALMALAIIKGDRITVKIEGEDETEAEKKLNQFFMEKL